MTNLVATVSIVVVTNWISVSRISPVVGPSEANYAVMRYDRLVQEGARVTNTVASIVWKGRTNDVVIETTPAFYDGSLKREIIDDKRLQTLDFR